MNETKVQQPPPVNNDASASHLGNYFLIDMAMNGERKHQLDETGHEVYVIRPKSLTPQCICWPE